MINNCGTKKKKKKSKPYMKHVDENRSIDTVYFLYQITLTIFY